MNKKGFIIAWDHLLQIVVLGLVLVALMGQVSQLDLSFVHRLYVVQDFGLLSSVASFLPGTLYYPFPEGESRTYELLGIIDKEITLDTGPTLFFSGGEDFKDQYRLFLYTGRQLEIKEGLVLSSDVKGNLQLHKNSHQVLVQGATPLHEQIFCEAEKYDFIFHPRFGGEEFSVYNRGFLAGSIEDATLNYDGMQKTYFVGDTQVFPGEMGEQRVSEILKKLIDASERELTFSEGFLAIEEISRNEDFKDKALIVTIEPSEKDFINFFVPQNHPGRKGVCKLFRDLMNTGEFEGGHIIPTNNVYPSLVFSSNQDFFTEQRIQKIGSALGGRE